MTTTDRRVALHLGAPVHVHAAGSVVPVRRRGLAILAYVALEGPTRREQLADVLWRHQGGLRNLRVELHRLRSAFAPIGVQPIRKAVDPLTLAPVVDIAQSPGTSGFLVGLDDISPEYQHWLEHRRHLADHVSGTPARIELLDDLALRVRPPFVIVLQGPPGSGRTTLARALAQRLHLPYLEDLRQQRAALYYVAPTHHSLAGLSDRISHDQHSIWVIGRSTFGEDSRLMLQVRASVPAERMRFVTLAPLTWIEAKHSLLEGVAFDEAAALYLASDGNAGYLAELLELRQHGAHVTQLPVPQRLRAAIALEARYLDERARKALERLSVHVGTFSPTMLDVLEASEWITELERSSWLRYDGRTWSFRDPLAAKLLREGLEPGYRLRLQQVIAAHLQTVSDRASDPMMHDLAGVARQRRPRQESTATTRVSPVGSRRVRCGSEVLTEPPRSDADNRSFVGPVVAWSRHAPLRPGDGVVWSLSTDARLVRMTGNVQIGTDVDYQAISPLGVVHVRVQGDAGHAVTIGLVQTPRLATDGATWLPSSKRFDHWFLLPPGSTLYITSDADDAVIEIELSAYRVEPASSSNGQTVNAWDLSMPSDSHGHVTTKALN